MAMYVGETSDLSQCKPSSAIAQKLNCLTKQPLNY